MKSRIVLKEIPSDKFHSAVFTTYSVNLYYFEQQVLPLLGKKGVLYVSILADSNMLNIQLDSHSLLSENKKRTYAVHGIQCKGAFHPKLIFLAGESSVMLLVGSGNLTSSGHGKNLEVWNSIYVSDINDEKLGLIFQAWSYLKMVLSDLGTAAQNKLRSIEENCILLDNFNAVEIHDSYSINKHSKMSLLCYDVETSLFQQLTSLIGNERINTIIVMSPYHDADGKFIYLLRKEFNPESIHIILQEDFGAAPLKMLPDSNTHFYNWSEVCNEDIRQDYFHAKNIIFEGRTRNFLLSGSANASMAAFGSKAIKMTNHEVCILYQSTKIDFLALLGIDLDVKKTSLKEFENVIEIVDKRDVHVSQQVFVKAIEKTYDSLTIYFSVKRNISRAKLCLYDAKGNLQFECTIDMKANETNYQVDIPTGLTMMYGLIFDESGIASNKQFIVDVNVFESTNPSPKNRSLNQIRKLIEGGSFSATKLIDYLNTATKQKQIKQKESTSAKSDSDKAAEINSEPESALNYLSYEEIQEKVAKLNDTQSASRYIDYKSVRLIDSIFSYLKESKIREDNAKIDEEETEDINKSRGRVSKKPVKQKKTISRANFDKTRMRVEKFLINYWEVIESKIDNKATLKPTLIDLSMFLIMLEILLHLAGHKERIEEDKEEEYLLRMHFSNKDHSWSEFTISFIGVFLLWCCQKGGFEVAESEEYNLKMNLYRRSAFKTCVGALALFNEWNQRYDKNKIDLWYKLGLMNADGVFNREKTSFIDPKDFEEFIPLSAREAVGESNFLESVSYGLAIIKETVVNKGNSFNGDFHMHPEDGVTYVEKVIENSNRVFYKLYSIGYEWDSKIKEYWNGKMFSVSESRWIQARRED